MAKKTRTKAVPGALPAATSGNPSGRRANGELTRTAFKPGESGNPKGLPAAVRELRLQASQHGPEMLERLLELARQKERPEIAIAAVNSLLDRMGARPWSPDPERLEVTNAGVDVRLVLRTLLSRQAVEVTAGVEAGSSPRQLEPGGS